MSEKVEWEYPSAMGGWRRAMVGDTEVSVYYNEVLGRWEWRTIVYSKGITDYESDAVAAALAAIGRKP
jgi:hypothetical protein